MSDDSFLRELEAASAAVDGDADAAARADADLVAAMEQTRSELAGVPVAGEDQRERVIATALAAFDAAPTAGATAAAPVPLDAARERRRRRYLALAPVAGIAAVALAIVGIAVMANGGEDKTSEAPAAAASTAAASEQVAATAGAAPSTIVAAGGGPDYGGTATTRVAGPGPLDSGAYVLPQVETPEQLQAFAASAREAAATTVPGGGGNAATSAPPLRLACDLTGLEMLGDISYQGQPAVAVRVGATGNIRAIAAGDCRVLVEVSP